MSTFVIAKQASIHSNIPFTKCKTHFRVQFERFCAYLVFCVITHDIMCVTGIGRQSISSGREVQKIYNVKCTDNYGNFFACGESQDWCLVESCVFI